MPMGHSCIASTPQSCPDNIYRPSHLATQLFPEKGKAKKKTTVFCGACGLQTTLFLVSGQTHISSEFNYGGLFHDA